MLPFAGNEARRATLLALAMDAVACGLTSDAAEGSDASPAHADPASRTSTELCDSWDALGADL
jgi:hypothetical protein